MSFSAVVAQIAQAAIMWNWMGPSQGTAEQLGKSPSSTQLWPMRTDTPVGRRASLQIRRVALLQQTRTINWVPVLLWNGLLGKYHLALQTASGHLFMAFLHPFGKGHSPELIVGGYQQKTSIKHKMQWDFLILNHCVPRAYMGVHSPVRSLPEEHPGGSLGITAEETVLPWSDAAAGTH